MARHVFGAAENGMLVMVGVGPEEQGRFNFGLVHLHNGLTDGIVTIVLSVYYLFYRPSYYGSRQIVMASNTEEHNGAGTLPEIELIIKASTIDGRRKGACLFCHEYFMDLYLLAELKTISLKITTVDMLKPPPDFRYILPSL